MDLSNHVALDNLIRFLFSLLPVFLFLLALVYLDSYKLVHFRMVVLSIVCGALAALAALFLNRWMIEGFSSDLDTFRRYVAPVVEEILKATYVIYLIKSNRVGFMVDAAIHGFAIGAGFAAAENIYYLRALDQANLLVWIIRGFGTAIMHGGATLIVAIVTKTLVDRYATRLRYVLPGLGMAVVIHGLFNHFVFSPVISTVGLIVLLPLFILAVFAQSEKTTRNWLGVGFDNDTELLEMINSGAISEEPVGLYLRSLKEKFPGEVVADMLCYLQLHLELSIRAKGILLMRETGFRTEPDPQVRDKLRELKYLEKSIGKTGRLAMLPFLRASSRDLWQIYVAK